MVTQTDDYDLAVPFDVLLLGSNAVRQNNLVKQQTNKEENE